MSQDENGEVGRGIVSLMMVQLFITMGTVVMWF